MQATLDRFATEYQGYHGLSAERARSQIQELRRLCAHAGKESPQDCDAADLRAYLASLVEQDLHVNTVRKRHGMLSPFFTWGFEADLVSGDQLMAIKLVKNPKGSSGKSEPKPYSPKQLSQLWTDIDSTWPWDEERWFPRYEAGNSRYKRIASTVCRRQFEAIIALALEGGLRRIEMFTASIDNVHYDNTSIIVPQRGERGNGKDHYREVPFTSPAREAMQQWLELRAWLKPGHDKLWIIGHANVPWGRELRPMSLKSFKHLPRMVGGWEYHRLRHTFATNWLRAGMPIEKLQRILGHANLQQTLAYAQITREDLEKEVSLNEAKFAQLNRRGKVA